MFQGGKVATEMITQDCVHICGGDGPGCVVCAESPERHTREASEHRHQTRPLQDGDSLRLTVVRCLRDIDGNPVQAWTLPQR